MGVEEEAEEEEEEEVEVDEEAKNGEEGVDARRKGEDVDDGGGELVLEVDELRRWD